MKRSQVSLGNAMYLLREQIGEYRTDACGKQYNRREYSYHTAIEEMPLKTLTERAVPPKRMRDY